MQLQRCLRSKMKYYIDFDNTLFDTESFYNDLVNLINKEKIKEEDINLIYKEQFNKELFNPIKIINYIIEKRNINKNLIKEINYFMKDISKYLYEDTIDFLEYLKQNNKEIVLLTYGDFNYQNEKISNCFIKEYFNQIIITSKLKGELDLDYQNSIFIDDSKEQIESLLKKNSKVIRIKRKGNKHSIDEISNVLEYASLEEYMKILKND